MNPFGVFRSRLAYAEVALSGMTLWTIWALAKQTGRYDGILRYRGEDGACEKASMDALGL